MPGATLEGTGLTLAYYQLVPSDFSGGDWQYFGETAPTAPGNYEVIASFAGSLDYSSASSQPAPFTISPATPIIQINAPGGFFNGQPYTATATVAGVVPGVDNTPGPTLENVGLTFDYQLLNPDGSLEYDLGSTAPTTIGSYRVIVSFAGSTDYASNSNTAYFNITGS